VQVPCCSWQSKALDEAPYKLSGAVAKLASITFLSLAFSYWIDNLGFKTEGKLAAIFIKPSLGVSNWPVIYFINYMPSNRIKFSGTIHHRAINKFFWRCCRGKRRLLQGEFRTHILYFVLSFAFTLILASFYKKHTKN
jgi:hypothetical protein